MRNGCAASWWRDRRHRIVVSLFLLLLALAAPPLAAAQLTPPSTGGVARLDRLLHRLAGAQRVLVIGAHPDDEDTALLALVSRGYGADAAYLSLSRGEGGQNLIGDELGIALGLIRSRELESARAIDGARQFFTRAYDFGYTRSLEETQRFWLPDSILKDVVRVVRLFRPHVIVTVFSGTPRDGHGQHQMAGVMARRAFAVAGDATVFPELAGEEGLQPWTALKLYRSTRFNRTGTTLVLPTGGLDPHSGRSYQQIAMASRSRHRSQDFGVVQRTGPGETRLRLVESRVAAPAAETGLFDGIPPDTGWMASFADSLRHTLSPTLMGELVPALAAALRRIQGRRPAALTAYDPPSGPERLLHEAIAVAAGLVLDVLAPQATMIPGDSLDVEVRLYNAGSAEISMAAAAIRGTVSDHALVLLDATIPPGTERTVRLTITVPPDATPTQPYFLARAAVGALYDWSAAPPAVRGLPFEPPILRGEVLLRIADTWIYLAREATYRYANPAIGEIREPLRVVPRIAVRLSPGRLVWSTEGPATQTFTVTLELHGAKPVAGILQLETGRWRAPDPQEFSLSGAGERRQFSFTVRRPATVDHADQVFRAVARTTDGERYGSAVRVLAYPHTRPTQWVVPAESRVRVAHITLPSLRAIGYVRGASDRVPEALQRIGLPVEIIDPAALAGGDLSTFDVIVVGARAYETDTALTRYNARLLDYARAGGRLVVQYQQYAFSRGEYAPFPLDIVRPHDRITDETSPVTMLDPEHPVFNFPNPITDSDWDDWPQERGLYFPTTWDDAYAPLLEMRDPDRAPVRGGLLVAPLGRGVYVYTGLSFFRALPAGTPGAYRLFMNLLALGRMEGWKDGKNGRIE
ncbi:MAG: PIG-L family deacetylase [Gemmatimonadetes bacterium]|nr:PIG-L family deacetylase [Gemmatimonadota bacterium]